MKNIHIKVLKRLLYFLFPNINVKPFFRPFISTLFKWKKDWGLIHTIKYYKQMRLHCTRYICGHPLLSNNMSIGLTKDGWPKKLLFLKPFVDKGTTSDLKFVLTILNFSRSWILNKNEWSKVKPDYHSIIDPPKGRYTIPGGFINKFVKEFALKKPLPSFSKDNIYLTTKSGPEGSALVTSYHSLLQYSYEEMQNIFNLTDQEGVDFFCKSYKHAWDNNLFSIKCKSNGKLSFVKDPESKLRIIAISDYFTQLYLKPIHNIVLNILKNNFKYNDRTFTQSPLHEWENNEESFWSLDLSSATDRFPIDLQRRLLVRIFNENFASSWRYILSNRQFVTPEGNLVKYSTGQPMGTYSSWAVFTLTHHLLVHWCASLNNITDFNQYILLGDDIVIKNDKVAKTYIKVLTKMGVEVSLNKTHVSKDTYEFAKRWIRYSNGKPIEITGIPLKGIINNFKNSFIVFLILYDYFKIKNNLYISKLSLVDLVRRLYFKFPIKVYLKSRKKVITKMLNISYKKFKRFIALGLSLDIDFGYYSYDKLRNLFAIMVTNDNYHIPSEREALLEYKRILSQGMANQVGKINNRIISNPDLLLSKFEEEDKNLLADNPIFIAVYNTIMASWEKVKSWDLSDSCVLHNASKEIQDLDIDAIFNKDRNKIQSLVLMSSIINNGFYQLNQTNEIWYGSFRSESTFTAPNDAIRNLQTNFVESALSRVMKGKWQAPMTTEELISSWENFKL